MSTLAELVANSRIVTLREAIVSTIAARRPECEVKGHIGKLDFSDVLAKDMFRPPAIVVAVTRARPDERLSSALDLVADVTAYVVAEDMILGDPGRLAKRDEVAWALSQDLLALCEDTAGARWDLDDIGHPDGVEAKPLFTAVTFERGTVYFVVTWRQTLFGALDPFWGGADETLPPPGFGLPGGAP